LFWAAEPIPGQAASAAANKTIIIVIPRMTEMPLGNRNVVIGRPPKKR
jgi:hypothetical protein